MEYEYLLKPLDILNLDINSNNPSIITEEMKKKFVKCVSKFIFNLIIQFNIRKLKKINNKQMTF